MKKIILIAFTISLCYGVDVRNVDEMSCMELLDTLTTLEKLKKNEVNENYEGAARLALAVFAGTLYFGDYENNEKNLETGKNIEISKKIEILKAKLSNCKPY